MTLKHVRIRLDHTTRPDVSDGHGGVWLHDDEPHIPAEAADALVGLGLAEFLDGSSTIKAKAAAAVRAEDARLSGIKRRAEQEDAIYEQMPPEWRDRVKEEGSAVINDYLATLPSVSLEQYDASSADPFTVANEAANADLVPEPVKRRGRPPGSKNRTKIEGEDA